MGRGGEGEERRSEDGRGGKREEGRGRWGGKGGEGRGRNVVLLTNKFWAVLCL